MNFNRYFEWLCASVGAFCGWFFGNTDGIFLMLVTLTAIDYVLGTFRGAMNGALSSNVGFKGLAKKSVVFCIIGVAHILDIQLLGQTAVLRDTVILFYCANEGISILENANDLGIPIPQAVKKLFLEMRDKNNNNDNEIKKGEQ